MFTGQGIDIYATSVCIQFLSLNASTNKDTQSNHFQNIGDLVCSGACLSEKMKVGDRDTQELLRRLLLRGPTPPAPELAAAPPEVLARIPEA